MSWVVGQVAWAWAKTGLWESDHAEAYAYGSDEEVHVVHDDYHENEEKPAAEPKDERSFDKIVPMKRTRLEVCDQEVNVKKRRCEITTETTVCQL